MKKATLGVFCGSMRERENRIIILQNLHNCTQIMVIARNIYKYIYKDEKNVEKE